MKSTMWTIAPRTLARDKTYALIDVVERSLAVPGNASLTVALQSPKAAHAHSVRALRYE